MLVLGQAPVPARPAKRPLSGPHGAQQSILELSSPNPSPNMLWCSGFPNPETQTWACSLPRAV